MHPDFSLLTSLLTIHLRWLANSATSLLDDVIEYAKTHEDAKGALLTFQKEADQIYSGWEEKLLTLSSHLCRLHFDWKNKAAARRSSAPAKLVR